MAHAWAVEDRRPSSLSKGRVDLYGFNRIGKIICLDDDIPPDASYRYWLVDIGDDTAQWREDLIFLVS